MWLNTLLTWFFAHFVYWLFDSGRVNPIDTWWYNRKIKRRAWRIPELCKHIYQKYGNLVELHLLGQRVLVITDMKIATSLMTNHGTILKQRFGNQFGLQNLNMHLTGLIWNNNVREWKRNRIIFESILSKGSKDLEVLALSHLETVEKTTLKIAEPDTVLELLRNFTLTMTMEALFTISMRNTPETYAWREEAKTTVANYFKAWEFYLLNPNADSLAENESHLNACSKMLQFSQEIFVKAKDMGGSDFISSLLQCNDDNGTFQCIAEMLLAGTDTSSLTMFYTMLFLADFPEVGNTISQLIHSETRDVVDTKISHLYFESMRLIPVGPVILRQCEADIEDGAISLKKGDGLIFNIAGMNRVHYGQSEQFNPSRYQYGADSLPLSFGTGKKSCVGKTFAETEMKLFFTWFLRKYTVLGNQDEMVGLLKTRWDIANAPVNDIKLTIFTRNLVFFVGQHGTGKSSMLDAIKSGYPRIKIATERKLRNQKVYSSNSIEDLDEIEFCNFQLNLIKTRLELLKTFPSQFVLIEGSVVDCLANMKVLGFTHHDYDEDELFRPMKNALIIHFPCFKKNDPRKERMDKEYLRILKRTGCRYHSLKSKTETDRFTEIMSFIGNR